MIRYPIVELRQYTLHPGQRDVLIELFDREFVETQEAVGMAVLGQFRDLDDPDRFVWLRGFPDMPSRAQSLAAFYAGPTWKAHSRAANATMVDTDDVLLLRPVAERCAFPEAAARRPPVGQVAPDSVVLATLCFADHPFDSAATEAVQQESHGVVATTGGQPFGCLSTMYAENTFPALPVRTGEHVLAWFTRFSGRAEMDEHLRLAKAGECPPGTTRTQRLRLAPTARSLLR
jgi:quinol monooxygenase YgiN